MCTLVEVVMVAGVDLGTLSNSQSRGICRIVYTTLYTSIISHEQLLLLAVGVAYALIGSVEEAVTALVVILLMINVRASRVSLDADRGKERACARMTDRV